MKTKLHTLIVLSIILLTSISCKEKVTKNELEHQKEEISLNANLDNYDPGSSWKLNWSDEFNNKSLDSSNWTLQVVKAGQFNDEWQRYTNSDKNAYIENKCLVIKAIHESDKHGMDQYTSARIHTANKQSWKYGKIAARMKLPEGQGIWPAFWMLGANINENGGDTPWPQCGEIDIFELYGSNDDGLVEANAHYANEAETHGMMGAASYKLKQGKFADDFHIFELEWDADKLSWFVNGEQFASMPITSDELSEFHKEFFILLNIAVGGTHAGRPDATSTFPQYMHIDWVRVYKKIDS